MIHYLNKLFIALLFVSTPCFAYDTDFSFNQSDKQLHFFLSTQGSATMGMIGTYVTKDKTLGPVLGFVGMSSLGILKELTDDHFSIGDLKADILGALAGSLLTFTVVRF